MIIWPILALLFAGLEAMAVWKGRRKVEYFAKPAVILSLMVWLFASTGLEGIAFWFGLGLLFSLIGDVALFFPQDSMFLAGLTAFLLTHILYLIGLRQQLLTPTAWSLVLLAVILLNAVRLLRRIAGAMRSKGMGQMVYPVIIYGLVISLMLATAMSTLSDPAWKAAAAFLITVGASLFWVSDLMLAWNKFVSPLKSGQLSIIMTYQLGQILLIAGVIQHLA